MKDLIIQAINETFEKLQRITPTQKGKVHFESIQGISPLRLVEFMEENNIPKDATFEGKDNGYDGYEDFGLHWVTPIPTTQADKEKFQKDWFNRNFGEKVGYLLKDNGYKRVPYNSLLFKKFDNVCKLTEYKNNNFDFFVEYFSLLWVKEEKDLNN